MKNIINGFIQKDKCLLKKAIDIFGDIIDEAYVTEYGFEDYGELEAKEELNRNSKDIEEGDDNEIVYDSQKIVIKFTNGNMVSFQNSEWGNISKFKLKTDKETWKEIYD